MILSYKPLKGQSSTYKGYFVITVLPNYQAHVILSQ